ncbi:MAG: hypothetical protein AB8G99_21685 [Planctomycetaceae bacterium]
MDSTARLSKHSRWCMYPLLAALMVVGISGCKQFILLSYLIGGPPSIEPVFSKQTGTSLTDFGVKVAVVCYAEDEILWDFDKVDHQIAAAVTHQLRRKKVDVISPDRVRAWLDQNPDWDRPQEIGAGLVDADGLNPTHIIYIDLLEYDLFEPDSANLYRGRSEATVSVFKMDEDGEGDGQKIFDNDLQSKYPLLTPESSSAVSYSDFRGRYLVRLSEEIGRLFYERYAGDDIPDGA